MKNPNRNYSSIALIVAIGLLIFYGLTLFKNHKNRNENPYAYEVDTFKQADSTLLHYRESTPIQFTGKKLTALTLGSHDVLLVAAGHEVFRVDSASQVKFWINAPHSVRCLAADHSGKIYLGFDNRISVYRADRTHLANWEDFPNGALLTSIAAGNDIYVADAGTRVVYRFHQSGKQLNRIGEKDPVRNIPGFVIPSPYFDLALTAEGSVWVVNPGRHTFEKYSPSGDLLESWGKTSMKIDGFSGCCNPSHIALMPNRDLVTSEKGLERIKVYSSAGQLLSVVAFPNQFDEGTVGLDLAVDSKGIIYVLDPARAQVRIFKKNGEEN